MSNTNIENFPNSSITNPIAVIAENLEREFDDYDFTKRVISIDVSAKTHNHNEFESRIEQESYKISFKNGELKFKSRNWFEFPADIKARVSELYKSFEERFQKMAADGVGKAANIAHLDSDDRPDAILNRADNVIAVYEYPTFFKIRKTDKEGNKFFEPWAKLKNSSGGYEWEKEEGEPSLYGEVIKLKNASTVFVFEGEKTADAAIRIRDNKPGHLWNTFLLDSAIVAFPGANRWNDRSLWSVINRPGKSVYIVPDNDENGRNAAKGIIGFLDNVTDVRLIDLQFSNAPVGADLADFENECPFDPADYVNADCARLTKTRRHFEGKKEKVAHSLTPWAKQHLIMNQETGRIFFDLNPASSWSVDGFGTSFAARMPEMAHLSFKKQLEHIDTVRRVSNRPLSFYTLTDWTKSEKQKRYNGKDYSTFSMAVKKAKEGNTDVFERYMKHLIPDETERELLLWWMAMTVIRPDIKLIWHPLLDSTTQGTGKGLFCAIITAILGEENTQPASDKNLKSQFNGFLEKKFVYFPEMLDADKQRPNALYENVKPILSDKGQTVEKKGIDGEQMVSYTSYIFCSNNAEQAIRFDEGDRRLFVPRVAETKLEEVGLVKEVSSLLEDMPALEAIVFYLKELLERKGVDEFPVNAPDTEKKREMIENSGSYWQRAIRTMVNNHFKNDDGSWKLYNIIVKEVRDALIDHCNNKKEYCPSAQKIRQELIVCGFVEPHKAFETGSQEWVAKGKHPRPSSVKFLMTPASKECWNGKDYKQQEVYENSLIETDFDYFPM